MSAILKKTLTPTKTLINIIPHLVVFCFLESVCINILLFYSGIDKIKLVLLCVLFCSLLSYLWFCISARIIHVMIGTNPEKNFFYYGCLLILDSIIYIIVHLLLLMLPVLIYGYFFFLFAQYRISNTTLPHYNFDNVINVALIIDAIVTTYMYPALLLKKMYPYETRNISSKWVLQGPIFLIRNIKLSLPVIMIKIVLNILFFLCGAYFTNTKIKIIIFIFFQIPFVFCFIMALYSIVVFGHPELFGNNNENH